MIRIDDSLRALIPRAVLGILTCEADVFDSSDEQNAAFDALIKTLEERYDEMAKIAQNDKVKATRLAYKALGKDPLKYRNSAESMLRRISKKNGLYRVNNAVDVNNMISVESGYSLGSYDMRALTGEIVWKRSEEGTKYQGIGKDELNVGCLPALFDEQGVFGNPTSDSRRSMIHTGDDKKLLYVIYAFDGDKDLPFWLDKTAQLLTLYANARNIKTISVL